MALTSARLQAYISEMQEKLDNLTEEGRAKIEASVVITFEDHFQFQQLQAEFHASGMLTPEAAQIIYVALGDSFTETNGGWCKSTTTAKKIAIMKLMEELLNVKLVQARSTFVR
jgi:hypothetical protein